MVGLKSAARQSDLTQKIDISDGRFKRPGKPKVALRFRKVHGLWSQVFYVFIGIALFFCGIRYVLEPKSFTGQVQRSVHSILEKNPIKHVQNMLGIKQAAQPKKPAKPPAKKVKKKRTRIRKHSRVKAHQKPPST